MMLATSVKRWEPSYNADITVTRHGVIVNQFLTKRPTDYHSFEPALAAVSSTLKPPQSWVGDGHYGTHANLIAAAKAGVVLYAGSARAAARSEEAAPPEGVPPATSEEAAPPEGVPPATTPTAIASPTDDAKTAVTAFRRADFRLDVVRSGKVVVTLVGRRSATRPGRTGDVVMVARAAFTGGPARYDFSAGGAGF